MPCNVTKCNGGDPMKVHIVEGLIAYEGGSVLAVFKDMQRAQYFILGRKATDRKHRRKHGNPPIFDGYYVSSIELQ